MSCLCLGYAKKKTHVVKHNNKRWKVKTVEGRAKGKGNDYQEDDVNGERLCSYFVAFSHWQGGSSQLGSKNAKCQFFFG